MDHVCELMSFRGCSVSRSEIWPEIHHQVLIPSKTASSEMSVEKNVSSEISVADISCI